jgi:leucyl-tRNA synthetase
MIYNFNEIEDKARQIWNYDDKEKSAYKVENNFSKPKYYVLDMFPYPSGAGLHVGHPLGYIFSDIVARYKRMQGFNVLHPMGFDAFGLPAEQYAIQTGQHPEITTQKNIETYRAQLRKIGFSYDWSREISTCEPSYYKHTQWIFLQLYKSIYCVKNQCAYSIDVLIKHFEEHGNHNNTAYTNVDVPAFTADEWKNYTALEKQNILMDYRLAYQKDSLVNWCPALGTVLANDEIVNGVSERGGHPVEKKKMSQWFLRITAYAERLLAGLDTLEWTDAMKEMQRNWIGKSKGAMVSFQLENHDETIDVFTTRVDTIFGVTFLVIAPEHELVKKITTDEYKNQIEEYIKIAGAKSDLERQAEVKETSGQFTGAYVLHPFTNEKVPVFIADYVLAGYGTGAVMAVPSGDQRDWLFAKKYNLPIVAILDAQKNIEEEADATKEGAYINSDFINGMNYNDATNTLIEKLVAQKIGYGKIQYRMRDAGYSRQRYWGEPFPIYYDENGIIHTVENLPIALPQVESYKPTGTGESPLATATNWVHQFGDNTKMETDTMPGYAGSSWYFLRYMDPNNQSDVVDFKVQDYWQNVDLYVGGSEHAVGHLLYSRFWHKFLKDIGKVSTEEPFKKMINQGMIGGRSLLTKVGQIKNVNLALHIPVNLAPNDKLSKDNFVKLKSEDNRFENIAIDDIAWEADKDGNQFISLDVQFEKMSKRYLNVVNPDDMVAQYGSDTFRMYEMFLGPIDTAKPWDTNGISGVANFLRKFWRLFYDDMGNQKFVDTAATQDELKILHKCIKKINQDIEHLSLNTCISTFMICVNDLSKLKTVSKSTLLELLKLISPFAPHTAEVLWSNCGAAGFVIDATYPTHDEQYLVESTFTYPIQINGKHRANIEIALEATQEEVEKIVLADEQVQKFVEGKAPKKFILVKGRIVNIVI